MSVIMKFYGIKKGKRYEEFKYWKARIFALIKPYLILNKKERRLKKDWYSRIYGDNHTFLHERENNIPEGKYHKPVSIIATELVAKEDINGLKAGLHQLIIKFTSHKYIGGMGSVDDINNAIDNINENLSSWDEWVECGRFDFERQKLLRKHIDYFDIKIRNFSSSYFALEIHIYFAEIRKNQIIKIINEKYRKDKGEVKTYYGHNSKKSGAKKYRTLVRYNINTLKSDLISDLIIETKWYVFNMLKNYLPIIFHEQGIIPPSVNLFKTNLDFEDKEGECFRESVGANGFYGQFSSAIRIYLEPITGKMGRDSRKLDMNIVVNEETYPSVEGYYSFDFGFTVEIAEKYEVMYKLFTLNTFNYLLATLGSKYRNNVNKIKIKKRFFKKILKTRYEFEKEFNLFRRFYHEITWEQEKNNATKLFKNSESEVFNDIRFLTEFPLNKINIIEETRQKIEKDIDQKITIIGHLNDHYNEHKNYRLDVIMLVISALTFLFVLYPKLTDNFRSIIEEFINFFS